MNYMEREIKAKILEYLTPNKMLVLLGPRRVGKTKIN